MKAPMVLTPHERLGKLVTFPGTFGKYRQNATMAGLHLTALLSRRSGSATARLGGFPPARIIGDRLGGDLRAYHFAGNTAS